MEKRHRLICGICAVCGMVGGILMVIAGFLEDGFPRPLWLAASVCMFLNVVGIVLNYRYFRKQVKAVGTGENK